MMKNPHTQIFNTIYTLPFTHYITVSPKGGGIGSLPSPCILPTFSLPAPYLSVPRTEKVTSGWRFALAQVLPGYLETPGSKNSFCRFGNNAYFCNCISSAASSPLNSASVNWNRKLGLCRKRTWRMNMINTLDIIGNCSRTRQND